MMESYWTFFHKNFFGSSLQMFLTSDEVGSIYVDFSSYNYETQMMMISKLFTIEKMKIWKIMLNFSKNFKIKSKNPKNIKNQKISKPKTVKIFKHIFQIFTVLLFWIFWIFAFFFEFFIFILEFFEKFNMIFQIFIFSIVNNFEIIIICVS